MPLLKKDLDKLPLLVKLQGVPFENWTMESTRIDFATIWVELDAAIDFVREA